MLAGDDSVDQFVGGTVYQAFLSATNYHRWHSPVAGTIVRAFVEEGTYYVDASIVSGDWFVVPGSGTGELTGLRGEGGFRANLGEGAQVHLDYWFE